MTDESERASAASQAAVTDQQPAVPVVVAEYVASLPERLVRSAAAAGGGMLLETSNLILPPPVRQHSKLYQATVARMIRITVEFVGGVTGRYPAERMDAGELAVRKLGGNAVEMASIVAVGFSPLWLLAAASDVAGGVRTYLDAFVRELRSTGALAESTDVSSVDDLLVLLENASSQAADTIDIPPLTIEHMRISLDQFRKNAELIPSPNDLAGLFKELTDVAREQDRSLLTISSLVAAGAIQAGIQLGNAHLVSFYSDSLAAIRKEGVSAYLGRISQPYLAAATDHFRPSSAAHTPKVIRRGFTIVRHPRREIPALLARVRSMVKRDRRE